MILCKTNKYSLLARCVYVSSLTLKVKFIWTSNENEITPESTVIFDHSCHWKAMKQRSSDGLDREVYHKS